MRTKITMLSGWCNTPEEVKFAREILEEKGFEVELEVKRDKTDAIGEEAEIERFFEACLEAKNIR